MTRPQRIILECSFDEVRETEAMEWARSLLMTPQRGYITTVNVAILMMIRSNQRLRRFIADSALTVADGQPIIWLSKLLRQPLPERVTGIDLCEKIAKMAAEEQKSIYLLGATDEVLDLTARQLVKDHPGLIIAGRQNGYFTKAEAVKRAADIRKSHTKILFVAMGVPRQEYFIQDHWNDLDVDLAIGLGGSFDVIAGVRKRAPKWIQSLGLEWLFRLLQEPRRLAKRYVVTNFQFLFLCAKELVQSRNK